METYQKREHSNSLAKWGASAGAVAALVVGRKKIAAYAVGGLEKVAANLAKSERSHAEFAVTRWVRDLEQTGESLRNAAAVQVGQARMEKILSTGIEEELPAWGAQHIKALFGAKGEHSWIFAGARRGVPEISGYLESPEFADMVEAAGGVASATRAILRARQAANVGDLFTSGGLPENVERQLANALRVHEKHAWGEFERLAEPAAFGVHNAGKVGWGRQLLYASGTKEATLSEVEGMLSSGSVSEGMRESLNRLLGDKRTIEEIGKRVGASQERVEQVVRNLRVEGLYNTEAGLKDLRGLSEGMAGLHDYLGTHFQIPIIPYISGFNPLSMAPWLAKSGAPKSAFIGFNETEKQLGLLDKLRPGMNLSVYQGKAVGVRFVEGGVETASEVEGTVRLLQSGAGGFQSRVVENLLASTNQEPIGGVRGFFGFGQHQPSLLSKLGSIFSKYSDPRYPSTALELIYGQGKDAPEEAVRSITSFLKRRGRISSEAIERLVSESPGVTKGSPIDEVLKNFSSDEAVKEFFFKYRRGLPEEYLGASGSLRNLLKDFDADPLGVIGRKKILADTDFFTINLLGSPDPISGVDLMRQALLDEYVLKYGDPMWSNAKPLLESLKGLGLTDKELVEAESFVHGANLSRLLGRGSYKDAISYMTEGTQSGSVQRTAEQLVNTKLSILEPFTKPSKVEGLPEVFAIREGESILAYINRSIKEGKSVREILEELPRSAVVQQGIPAFFKGIKDPVNFTTGSLPSYFMAERLNTSIADYGLGLSPEHLGSGWDILSGLIFKRVLPGWAAYEAWNYLNYESENDFGTSPKDVITNVRARARIARAHLTGWMRADDLFPGFDRNPILAPILSKGNVDEELQQLSSGYEPVRQGRYWMFGTGTPFTGGKIQYYLPDPYQRAHSNWESADNADLSTARSWSHSILPTPRYPLSFVEHFADPYWWESAHSMGSNPDRPYVISGPMSDPSTPWGPIVNSTIGQVLKPTRVLYPEYDPRNMKSGTAYYGYTPTEDDYLLEYERNEGDDYSYDDLILSGPTAARTMPAGAVQLASVGGRYGGGYGSAGIGYGGAGEGGYGGIGTGGGGGYGNLTSGRAVVSMGRGAAYLGTSGGGRARLKYPHGAEIVGYLGDPTDTEYPDVVGQSASSLRELAGIYGWGTAVLTGTNDTYGLRMDDPSAAYGAGARYWSANIGGLGGVASEIGRRFLYKRPKTAEYYDPVPNSLADTWLPGSSYFTNFQRGDPYADNNGLLRLPGEAYERAHGVKLMLTRASSVGKSPNELLLELIHQKEPLDEEAEKITGLGTQLHKVIQSQWRRQGVLLASEVPIFDDKVGVSGHMDAVLNWNGSPVIAEIKTMSEKRYNMGGLFPEHQEQLNFYMHTTGISRGLMVYVNRDDARDVRTTWMDYSPGLYASTMNKLNSVRRQAKSLVDSGVISRADLYDDITRFEILSDVAAYSDEFYGMRDYLSHQRQVGQLDDAQFERFKAAKKRAMHSKEKYNLDSYRFAGSSTTQKSYVVDRIVDPNTILVEGSDTPIRLAGVRGSGERIAEYFSKHHMDGGNLIRGLLGMEDEEFSSPAEEMYARVYGIRKGSEIDVGVSTDPEEQYGKDMFGTERVVLYHNGVNISHDMLMRGLAVEKETDYSSAGVEARFTPIQRGFGTLYEELAHADTPFNTKLSKVRSPVEEYIRTQVYGKLGTSWSHPIASFITPTIEAYAVRDPILAGVSMAAFASMFGRTKSMKGKLALVGLAAGAAASLGLKAHELSTGEPWIPKRVRKRREIEEYYDILKYTKYMGLYEYAKREAKSKESFDVEGFLLEEATAGDERNRIRRGLVKRKAKLKHDMMSSTPTPAEQLRSINSKIKAPGDKSVKLTNKDQLKIINQEINSIAGYRKDVSLGPWASQAILYKQMADRTMYAAEPTDFRTMMGALPKYEREILIKAIANSTPEERKRLYGLLPDYEKRLLGPHLGFSDKLQRMELAEYFKTHTLPSKDWEGWREDVPLEALKIRTIRYEGLDPMDFGVYPQVVEQVDRTAANVEVPTVNGKGSDIENALADVLAGQGLSNLNVHVRVVPDRQSHEDVIDVNMDIRHDRRADLVSALRKYY
jgi:hypothetical protein